ncbi:MAG: LOG family protein [bacterium]|nr:LOG family protein [bacterium]
MKRAPKAYKNIDFLKSREARALRILAEYMEPEKRFEDENLKHTVVFFGSARIREDKEDKFNTKQYYKAAEEFAFKLANWSKELEKKGDGFTVCSGGGPGIMEAANKGAQRAGAKTMGMNISIPFEQDPNDYISPELNFEFHYFFMRKLWFLYHAKALIVFPGGFGTFDELFETLTLIQTGKLDKNELVIMLYDEKFWKDLINFPKMIEYGLISAEDVNLFHFFSSPDEGLEYLKPRLGKLIKNFKI